MSFSFWVQLFQHLSGMFNYLHLIASAQVLREVLIEIALWSGITGKSLGRKRGVTKLEHWYVGSLSCPSRRTQQESTQTYFSMGQGYFNYSSRGCTHLTTLCWSQCGLYVFPRAKSVQMHFRWIDNTQNSCGGKIISIIYSSKRLSAYKVVNSK